jgi:hypothetical protein
MGYEAGPELAVRVGVDEGKGAERCVSHAGRVPVTSVPAPLLM